MYDFHGVIFSFSVSIEECILLSIYRLSASVLSLVEGRTVLCNESESACNTARNSSLTSLINCHNLSSNSVKTGDFVKFPQSFMSFVFHSLIFSD